jgi:chemotaxis family two-component system sensor kinase Cph1
VPRQVNVDAERVYQMLANLVGDAITFTDEHGTVRVEATVWPTDDTKVQITVSDNGRGMFSETHLHIFERYWLVREGNPRGTGLGLYIAKGLIISASGRELRFVLISRRAT